MNTQRRSYDHWWYAFLLCVLCQYHNVLYAEEVHTPADIFAITQYAVQLTDGLLAKRGVKITDMVITSQERDVKPMHVYQLYTTVLTELYLHELNHQRHPPPLIAAAPINYTPTETHEVAEIVVKALEELYRDEIGPVEIQQQPQTARTPSEVYQLLFELYVKLIRLNGKEYPTADGVYAQLYRTVRDLRNLLITLAQRLPDDKEREKRLLVTATYGLNIDGSHLAALETNATPVDVLMKTLSVRDKINAIRKKYRLPEIQRPDLSAFKATTFADVFLQTQIIIAELNIVKMSQQILTVTNLAQPVTGKTPADDHQQVKHIDYMLERLQTVL